MTLHDDAKLALRALLHSPYGAQIMAYLNATPAKMPVHFTPTDNNLQPHHIQMHHGFAEGLKARNEQIEKLAELPMKSADEDKTPHLFNTRTL